MQIYIARAGNQQGPYSIEELNKLAQSEPITGDDQCWYEGCAEWVPLSHLPGFIPAPPPRTTAAPEVFTLTQQPSAASTTEVRGSSSPLSPFQQSMATASPVPVAPRALITAKRRLPLLKNFFIGLLAGGWAWARDGSRNRLLKAFIVGVLVGGGLGWSIRDARSSSDTSAQSSPPKGQSKAEQHQLLSPPDDVIIKGARILNTKLVATPFRRGATLVSRGMKRIPHGTPIYPVKFDDFPITVYYTKDKFGDWKVFTDDLDPIPCSRTGK